MRQDIGAAFRLLPSALAFVMAMSFASAAAASPTYPAAVQEALGTCTPPCTLCHVTLAGVVLNDRFGEALKATTNLPPANPGAVKAALERMELGPDCTYSRPPAGSPPQVVVEICDTDDDGEPDITELRNRRDPNIPGAGALCDGPTYGCGARLARGTPDFDWVALLIAGAAAATLIAGARRARRPG